MWAKFKAWVKANPKKFVAIVLAAVVLAGGMGVGCKLGYVCGKAAGEKEAEAVQ